MSDTPPSDTPPAMPPAYPLGKEASTEWRPELLTYAEIRMRTNASGKPEFYLDATRIPYNSASGRDLFRSDTEAKSRAGSDPAAKQLDITIYRDCYVMLQLDETIFDGWITAFDAITTRENHEREYFGLKYYAGNGDYVDREKADAMGLKTYRIVFGARWMAEAYPTLERHKFYLNFIFGGNPTSHDPDIRNPQDP